MFRNSLLNLWTTMYSLYLAVKMGRWSEWRYPRIIRQSPLLTFHENGHLQEKELFEYIKNSWILGYLKRVDQPLVIRCGYYREKLFITAYRFINDDGRTDLSSVKMTAPGYHGTFHYVTTHLGLYHTLRNNGVLEARGYVEEEPVFSLSVAPGDRHIDRAEGLSIDEPLTLGGDGLTVP